MSHYHFEGFENESELIGETGNIAASECGRTTNVCK
jgi:hypothetical protein